MDGLTPRLLERNPKFLNTKVNGTYATNPFRLGPAQAATADQNHGYTEEQLAFHAGLMDSFPQYTGLPALPIDKFSRKACTARRLRMFNRPRDWSWPTSTETP